MTGRTLGHYQVLERLGAGGMGEVYKARDTRLNRFAAIKFLKPEHVAQDGRKQRFIQEAQAASALNHPNIITIYDIGQNDGIDFLVMEFVAGATLDGRIPRQGMRLSDALRIAVQIAEGLARAHAAGIVHRDLKPSNIMVADGGLVKILDFGLAKLTDRPELSSDDTTRTQGFETEEGTVLGTTAYMSPEQAEGRKVDTRSDIFSFGVVLYEMLTGRRAFERDTRLATLAAILKEEPAPVENIPAQLDWLLKRALRKDRERRFQHMDDLRIALADAKEETEPARLVAVATGPMAAVKARPRVRRQWLAGAAIALAAFAAGAFWKGVQGPAVTYQLRQITADSGLTVEPALSPDGRLIAYASDRATGKNLDIWVHPLTDNAQPIRLTSHDSDDRDPAFSADGSQIAFYSRRDGGGIYVMPALGGQERLLVRGGAHPRYSPDGRWLAYSSSSRGENPLAESQVYVMPAMGGAARRIGTELGWAANPVWAPDSRSVVFSGMAAVGDIQSIAFWRAQVEGGAIARLPVAIGGGRYFADDWLGDSLLISGAALRAVDPAKASSSRIVFTTASHVERVRAVGGRIVFASTPPLTTKLWSVAVDHNTGKLKGPVEPLLHASGSQRSPAISADGRKLIYSHIEPVRAELRSQDTETGKETVLQPGNLRGKVSPDGTQAAYGNGGGAGTISLIDTAGGQAAVLVPGPATLYGWAPGGGMLVYYEGGPIRWFTFDLITRKSKPLVSHRSLTIHGVEFSPDRRWVAFHIPSEGAVYVAPVRDGTVAEEADWIRATGAGGMNARPWWSPDGNLLYWVSERDGFVCIWAQPLHADTKKPDGEAFGVLHFHEARRSLATIGLAAFGPAVSRDRLTFALPEYSGNIWLAEPEAPNGSAALP